MKIAWSGAVDCSEWRRAQVAAQIDKSVSCRYPGESEYAKWYNCYIARLASVCNFFKWVLIGAGLLSTILAIVDASGPLSLSSDRLVCRGLFVGGL